MLKNILKLEGAQKLSKNEQKSIRGGKTSPLCDVGGYLSSEKNCLEQPGGGYWEIETTCCFKTL